MTTKPKARKFRIRRSGTGAGPTETDKPEAGQTSTGQADAGQAATGQPTARPAETNPAATPAQTAPKPGTPAPQTTQPSPTAQGTPTQPAPTQTPASPAQTVHEGQVASANEMNVSQDIDQIRQEGLTGRQLRMARRMAQKHGLAPTSDFDAVRLLRARGIDPFQRSNIVELVAGGGTAAASGTSAPPASGAVPTQGQVQLPQTVPVGQVALPTTDVNPAERRANEIRAIQRDIAARRRKKMLLLLSRLAAFVMLPTVIAGYYFYFIATPMYSTHSEFLIITADGGGGGAGGLGGLLPAQFATGQDAIAVQSYLQSKDAMLRLNDDVGFKAQFGGDYIDPIQRLDPGASNEAAYKVYKKYVKLGYDPTEGVIRMEVATSDPEVSKVFSEKLLEYAEERVDNLSAEKRFDAVKTAQSALEEAKEQRRAAQRRMVELQEGSILDPEGEIANIRSLISNVELQLQEKQLALSVQLNNSRPNAARVEALRSEVEILGAELSRQNARLTQATSNNTSLASQAAEIQMAQADLATADMVLQSALETKRQSQIEANKQVRYLTVAVSPVASEDPSYPRKFENTLLAFLIFGGIYLLVSLTASVLKEQVSS